MEDNGIDLFDAKSPIRVMLGRKHEGVAGPRVGVSKAADRPWRVWLAGRPRCRSIAAAHGHRLPAKATSARRSVL